MNDLDSEQSVCLVQRNSFLERKQKEMERKIRIFENGGVEPEPEPEVEVTDEWDINFKIVKTVQIDID